MKEPDTGIEEGMIRTLLIGPKPFQIRWQALHEDFIENEQFVDSQLSGPFSRWIHHHRFEKLAAGESTLCDHLDFQFPLNLPLAFLLKSKLQKMFRYRHRQTSRDLTVINRFPSPLFQENVVPLKIGVTGSSGLVGSHLCSFLQVAGHKVVPLKLSLIHI